MTNPTQADLNAPPGGGPNATVVASSVPAPTPAPAPPAPGDDPTKLQPVTPPAPPAPQAPVDTSGADIPDFGDPGLNVAADYFVNTLGLSLDSPELVEAANGNYAYLDAKIAQLGDKAKGAGTFVNLAKEAQARIATATKAQKDAAVQTIYTAVGGEENWKAVSNFARQNLPAQDLDVVSAALNKGGIVAEAMAKHLLSLASASPSVAVHGQATTDTSVAPAVPLQAATPLTPTQYRAEYKKLIGEYGITGTQRGEGKAKLEALNARYRPQR